MNFTKFQINPSYHLHNSHSDNLETLNYYKTQISKAQLTHVSIRHDIDTCNYIQLYIFLNYYRCQCVSVVTGIDLSEFLAGK